jgi:hypothetical protein
MSDQTTQPTEAEPNAAVDTPQDGTDTQPTQEEVDYQKRYTDLQAEYTRTRQQMTDPEYQQQVAQEWLTQHGYALPEDEPDPDEFADPNEALRRELEELKQWRDQFESSTQQQQQIQALEESTEAKLAQIQGLDDDDKNWIVSRAIVLPPHEDGSLDVDKAYQELVARDHARMKQWRDTKRAPHISPNGQAGTGVPNLDDMSLEELTKWQAQRFADLSAD